MIRLNSRRLSVVTLATTLLAAAGGTLAVDADRKTDYRSIFNWPEQVTASKLFKGSYGNFLNMPKLEACMVC